MFPHTSEPMRAPLPPQTRYDYPINKLQSYLLQAVFWLPMVCYLYGIRVKIINGPVAIPLFCLAWLVGMTGLVAAQVIEPWVGSRSTRVLELPGRSERICVFQPYFGRKCKELSGGTVELERTGEVFDLDAPYGTCTIKNKTWKQRYEPAQLVLRF